MQYGEEASRIPNGFIVRDDPGLNELIAAQQEFLYIHLARVTNQFCRHY
jgi:hypothetical protein